MNLLVINGANLDMLGQREPDIYGTTTLAELENELRDYGRSLDCAVDCVSSNIEGEIIEFIHSAQGKYDGIILNAGGYSHYSIAIRDAIAAVEIPTVEVHLTNIFARDFFRQVSITGGACIGCISGLGIFGYKAAIEFFVNAVIN